MLSLDSFSSNSFSMRLTANLFITKWIKWLFAKLPSEYVRILLLNGKKEKNL